MPRASRASRYPVASFGPELLAAIIKGAREEVTISMPDRKSLTQLQARIHMLRAAMGRESHPSYTLVQRARTSRMWDPDPSDPKKGTNFRLIIKPNDMQFADAIRNAGVKVDVDAMRDVLNDAPNPTILNAPSPPTMADDEPTTSSETDPYANFK